MPGVVIGWVDNGNTRGEFTESVARLSAFEVAAQRLHGVIRVKWGPLIDEARNELVSQFLETDGDWLFMVDTDMVFNHLAIAGLIEHADPDTAPVVAGLCYGINQEYGQFPTIYHNQDGHPVVMLEFPETGMVECDGTGAAFILQHRSVFENYEREGPHPWYHRLEVLENEDHPGGVLGEDISWCWWLRENDVPIFVNVDVEAGHVKAAVVNSASYKGARTKVVVRPKLIIAGSDNGEG